MKRFSILVTILFTINYLQAQNSNANWELKIIEIYSDGSRLSRPILPYHEIQTFKTQDELDDLSALYEDRLKLMGGAGRSGEFYTPRPLIQAMIRAIDPALGKTIYDGAAGSAGFLTESYVYLKNKVKTPTELTYLKQNTFYGKNKNRVHYLAKRHLRMPEKP